MTKPLLTIWLLSMAMFSVGTGCKQTLETGYEPRLLNASDSDRKSYYAPEFTPEAHPPKDSNNASELFQHH